MKKFSLIAAVLVLGVGFVVDCSAVDVLKGTIYQAYVDYNDTDTVLVTAGYGECNGHYWEISEPLQHDMTSLTTSEDFHYIYISDADSNYPFPTIIDSTAEPVWSNSKLGWYDVNDRCIGVVWSTGTQGLKSFKANSLVRYFYTDYVIPLSNGNPTGVWEFLDCSQFIPVNAISIMVKASNYDVDGPVWVTVAMADALPLITTASYGTVAQVSGWLDRRRNGTRQIRWSGQDDDDNRFEIRLQGYQIER